MGAFLGVLLPILGFAFILWCILRTASYQSRIEEQYRVKSKKKKGKK